MSLRQRSGNWHHRFYTAGRTWTADTGLAATKRSRNAAPRAEVEAQEADSRGAFRATEGAAQTLQ
jgi:hypothetical protein